MISLVTSSILLNSVLDNSSYRMLIQHNQQSLLILSYSCQDLPWLQQLIITYCVATSMSLQKGIWPSHWLHEGNTSFSTGVSPSCTVGRAEYCTASVSPIVHTGATSGSMASYVQPLCVLMYCTLLEYVYIYLIIVG